ncbi:LANO_0D04016g1_1 [Lachancea nothofagi CBS 11611]|uniref:LANO_0D04016g1_1 n=1 Tax=Lachancea nothofagi CBS 11611 TaxID=1266666 RepID=A0A1G4JFR0_9SACH|nr:LANO_0D04016g1_1 [Lachancea nothofagi CBS 11611]
MTETQGPLDTVPEHNYPPSITQNNYWAVKELINQVVSEDQEYVTWKLKDVRTGGTMNSYLNDFFDNPHSSNSGKINRDESHNTLGRNNGVDGKIKKTTHINSVPKNLRFPRDIHNEQVAKLPQPRILDQSEQLNLLLTNLDEEQMNRFEVFRRTSLAKNNIKKISGLVTNQTVAANINLLLAGVGKIFVGEIVEKAQDIKKRKLASFMASKFREKKLAAYRLKKSLKKLTLMVESSDETVEDSVDENESDVCEDEDDEKLVRQTDNFNNIIRSRLNSEENRIGIIKHYNKLVKSFNALDVSVEKYANGPLLPEHIREAWRLYRIENDTVPQATWRTQGEGNGWMFR